MKRYLGPVFLGVFCFFGVVLLLDMQRTPEVAKESEVHTIHVSSNRAIIDFDELPDFDKLKIVTDDPDAKVLIRVTGGNPTKISKRLESNGSIYIINKNGVIVGPDAEISLSESPLVSTLDHQRPVTDAPYEIVEKNGSALLIRNH